MGRTDEVFLNKLLGNIIKKENIYSTVLCVESGDGRFSWTGAAGGMNTTSRYFTASVTKLYVTTIIIKLAEEEMIGLDDFISDYLPEEFVNGIHRYKGVDYSSHITIRNLLSNTSGLPDYFFQKDKDNSAAGLLLSGIDEPWDIEKVVHRVKKLPANFPPGRKGKASYSDTNYTLIGKIIEIVTGKPINAVFREYIFDPLRLTETYIYNDPEDDSPVPFYYKKNKLWLPKYMTSVLAGGGIVTTAEECMLFLKAFFQGYFFPTETIELLKKWKLIFPPPGLFYFGVGLEKFWTPWIISPFKPISDIVGFWGQTGSFAWYNPDTDLYFCGTTNQVDGTGHAAIGKMILKMIKAAL